MTGGADRALVISRVLAAPRRLVFAAWTDPRHAVQWWGPQGFTNLSCEMDVRPGGAWRRRMQGPDGEIICKYGRYQEIVPPERLVFTYADETAEGGPGPETLVTVTLAEDGAGTRLTLRHEAFATAAARDSHLGGWTSCMERFVVWMAQQETGSLQ